MQPDHLGLLDSRGGRFTLRGLAFGELRQAGLELGHPVDLGSLGSQLLSLGLSSLGNHSLFLSNTSSLSLGSDCFLLGNAGSLLLGSLRCRGFLSFLGCGGLLLRSGASGLSQLRSNSSGLSLLRNDASGLSLYRKDASVLSLHRNDASGLSGGLRSGRRSAAR